MNLIEESHISFLNLDHRTDRLERMTAELKRVGLPVNRTRGGRTWQGDSEYAPFTIRNGPTPETEGCSVGQMFIMEEALQQAKHAWVMEDDLVFCNDFPERLKIIEEFLEEHDWDVFWFGGTYHREPTWHKDDLGRDVELTENPRIVRTYGCWSTFAYCVNREALGKILAYHTVTFPESKGIDTTFIEMQPDLYTYAFVPGCVKQVDNWSDITHSVSAFSGFERLGPHWFQETMNDFTPEPGWLA